MIEKLRRRIAWEIEGFRFLRRNLACSAALPEVSEIATDGLVFGGCAPSDLRKTDRLHRRLRGGDRLNLWRRMLYQARGRRLLIIGKRGSRVIAFQMLYFRADEADRGIVHEAFIGVDEAWRGKGVASRLRRLSADHFGRTALAAISSNIPRDNQPSLRSAVASGFRIDQAASGVDYYLFLNLNGSGGSGKECV